MTSKVTLQSNLVPDVPVWFLTRLIHCLTIPEASFLTSEKKETY